MKGRKMLSDALYEGERSIRKYQLNMPDIYDRYADRINAIRAQMIALMTELDRPVEGGLDDVPTYQAALKGDPTVYDAFMESDLPPHECMERIKAGTL
ncbi:hypothetical protein J2847_005065 [Azospirillum agricola]|uniref:hypothetical protein n=1 Tax=Azospirillum agricola TaxID=1720247 RepID=UPI001AE9CEE7|nr:hypothetical protein [Azospirillum agricola]MBP2231746.1 hypothetical protein [Azospirillum agricola]